MLNFKCASCENDIQAEYQYIGELVECPLCSYIQIVPDPPLSIGSEYQGYKIRGISASSLLWTSYRAVGMTELPERDVLLKIPSTFFRKRVTDFNSFVDAVIKSGSLNIPEFPALLDRNIIPGKEFFVFDYAKSAHSINSFGKARIGFYDSLIIIRGIAAALQKAWEKNLLVHQNLNPKNVRVKEDREVRIFNMGISSFLLKDKNLLDQGFNIWDYHYMSPEFIKEGKADTPSCDIYSLGGLLFLLITGHDPYELVGPEEVTEAPISDPLEYNPDIPPYIITLFQSMMAKDINTRLSSWDDVIILADQLLDRIKLQAQQKIRAQIEYNSSGAYTGEFGPIGYTSGSFKGKKIAKKKVDFSGAASKSTETVAKLVPPTSSTDGIHREWQSLKNTRQKRSASSYAGLIVSVAFLLLIGGFLILMPLLKDKKQQAENLKEREELDVKTPVVKVVLKETEAESATEKAEPKAAPEQGQKLSLVQKIALVDKYYASNPEDYDNVIKEFEKLIPEAVEKRDYDLLDSIRIKIDEVEGEKDEKVKVVITELNKEVSYMVKSGEYDKAIKFLKGYTGKYAAETSRERAALIEDMENKLGEITAKKQKAIQALNLEIDKIASPLLNNKIEDSKEVLISALLNPEMEPVADTIKFLLRDIDAFEKLKNDIDQKTGDKIIEEVNILKLRNDFLLRALIYTQKKEWEKARDSFKKVSCGKPEVFFLPLLEIETGTVFSDILGKYNFKFDKNKPEFLLRHLTKRAMSADSAERLFSEIEAYEGKYKNAKFLVDNANVFDALKTFCKRFGGVKKIASKITIQSSQQSWESGQKLFDALAQASADSTIHLEEGIYKSPQNKEFNISQTGITLTGDENVILEGNLVISGKSITVSNIRIDKGEIKITPNSENVKMTDCINDSWEAWIKQCKNLVLENCFFRGVLIENSEGIVLKHCTLITPRRAAFQSASLWINGGTKLDISSSIIYGEKYGVIFSDKGKARNRIIRNTLWYGEEGYCALQIEGKPIEEKNIIKKKIKLGRCFRLKANIYTPPQFVNTRTGDWRLVRGISGCNAAEDGKDCGVLWK